MSDDAPRLAIDADAEARLRAGGELEGAWQVPSELARRAFRAGARHVSVACERDGFAVRDDGPPLDAETRGRLERVLDRRASGRDQALAGLEEGLDPELRFLAALQGGRIEVQDRVVRASRLVGWDAERAREWLRSVGRFASDGLTLDGSAIAAYATRGLASVALVTPWPGRLWLRESGEDGVLWLLRDRIVSGYFVLPGHLPFEAVLDLSLAGAVTAAALRERVAPAIAEIVEQAARLTCETGARASALRVAEARRVRVLLLSAARLRRWRGPALRAPAYPVRVGAEERWLSLADLGAPSCAGPDRRIATCEPADVARSLFLSDAPAVVLDEAERNRLAQELGLRFSLLPLAERVRG